MCWGYFGGSDVNLTLPFCSTHVHTHSLSFSLSLAIYFHDMSINAIRTKNQHRVCLGRGGKGRRLRRERRRRNRRVISVCSRVYRAMGVIRVQNACNANAAAHSSNSTAKPPPSGRVTTPASTPPAPAPPRNSHTSLPHPSTSTPHDCTHMPKAPHTGTGMTTCSLGLRLPGLAQGLGWVPAWEAAG
ncbi:hypothetical protein BDZ94DRAFT_1243784 [Collybia nuda]|uniref:Uncharacterized protein n=1 Tax=Collybia nuda TaxID=64659 RepID=A0A9P6CPC7_9AGAR|nr:hypothetical protein BDZ94DRAFT_1243784 [Collybia nuda]